MNAREQLEAIRSAPSTVVVLDEESKERERHEFEDRASAIIFSDLLSLPNGWTTVVSSDVNGQIFTEM